MNHNLRALENALRTVMHLQMPLFRDNRPLAVEHLLTVAQVKASLDHHRRTNSASLMLPCSLEQIGYVANSCVPIQTFVPFALERFAQQTQLSEYFAISLSWIHADELHAVPRYMFVSSLGRGIMSLQGAERCEEMRTLVHEVLVPMYLRYFDSSSMIQPGTHFKWAAMPQFWPCNLNGELEWIRDVHMEHYMDTERIRCPKARGLLTFLLSDYWWNEDRLVFNRVDDDGNASDDDDELDIDLDERPRSPHSCLVKYRASLLPYEPAVSIWNDDAEVLNLEVKSIVREKPLRDWMARIHKQLRKDIKTARSTPVVFVHTRNDAVYGEQVGRGAARKQCASCRSMCIQQSDKAEFLRNKADFVEVRFIDDNGVADGWEICTDQVLIRRDLLELSPVLRQRLRGEVVLDLGARGVHRQHHSTIYALLLYLYAQQPDAVSRLQQIAGPGIHPPDMTATLVRRPLVLGKGRSTTDSVIVHPQHRELVHSLTTSCWGPRSVMAHAVAVPLWDALGLQDMAQLSAVMTARLMYRELRGKKL